MNKEKTTKRNRFKIEKTKQKNGREIKEKINKQMGENKKREHEKRENEKKTRNKNENIENRRKKL